MPNLVSLIPNLPPSREIGQIYVFRVCNKSLIIGNCHNSRTSDDIDMKLGKATKCRKGNKTTPKKFDDTSCRKIVTSLSFFQFLSDYRRKVCKTYVFINSNPLTNKELKQN